MAIKINTDEDGNKYFQIQVTLDITVPDTEYDDDDEGNSKISPVIDDDLAQEIIDEMDRTELGELVLNSFTSECIIKE